METREKIAKVGTSLTDFLLEKNRRYGNSALEPAKVFSKLDSEEGLKVRMDDKIKRISNSSTLRKNDVVDLIGYLMLICVEKDWTDFEDLLD